MLEAQRAQQLESAQMNRNNGVAHTVPNGDATGKIVQGTVSAEAVKYTTGFTRVSQTEISHVETVVAPKKKTNSFMLEKELAKVESDIARYEATIKMYTVQLQDPSIQGDIGEYERLSKELEDTTAQLETLYERWERLSEEA